MNKTCIIDVSVIFVNYNATDMLIEAIRSVMQHTREARYEIIVVDNASPDGGAQRLSDVFGERINLIKSNRNLGFGGANNLGMKHARGLYFFLLNPDTLVLNPAIDLFFRYAEAHKDEPIGALGCILFDAHYRPANSYHYFLTPRFLLLEAFGKHRQVRLQAVDEPMKVDFITGADLFIPRRAIERVGMFDPRFFMYCEEVDLEKRMADVGLDRLIIPGPQIVHYDGGSYQPQQGRSAHRRLAQDQSKLIYIHKHFGRWCFLGFKVLFLLCRIPAYLNPHYRTADNLAYLKMVLTAPQTPRP
ncbi:glycosyltransferase family 2 protein [Hoylesella marshii]|uniref:glycosyltransferase family 2 protein n=1 Tax=Hoylesella marshii TaxID=189722 RepID=UPI0028D0FF49|nr:glycosyltransferase family 2 protein [Hoylesella marshii]